MHGKKLSRISSCQINIILIIKNIYYEENCHFHDSSLCHHH